MEKPRLHSFVSLDIPTLLRNVRFHKLPALSSSEKDAITEQYLNELV